MNCIITGTSRGIGHALVNKFLANCKENDKIFALSRNIESFIVESNDSNVLVPIKCDITNHLDIEKAINTIQSQCKSIDYLINNAGLILNKPFTEINSIDIDDVFSTNFKSPFFIIQKLLPLLELSKMAHVVNISSMGGFQGAPKFNGLSAYSSSKAALTCLTECLAEEFKLSTVRFNALCIGAVNTEMLSKAFPDYKAPISAIEMADFIHNFTCNNHKFMNGKVIPVALSTP